MPVSQNQPGWYGAGVYLLHKCHVTAVVPYLVLVYQAQVSIVQLSNITTAVQQTPGRHQSHVQSFQGHIHRLPMSFQNCQVMHCPEFQETHSKECATRTASKVTNACGSTLTFL